MLSCEIEPHISDTNATGHIDNAAIPVWLERARSPIYRIFNAALAADRWNLIIRRIELDFLRQINYPDTVTITSRVGEIRNSSFSVAQEISQNGQTAAQASVVLVYYDYASGEKQAIGTPEREQLQRLVK